MTTRAAFKQSDVTRALKGVQAAGLRAERVEIDPTGEIVVYLESKAANDDGRSDWEDM